MLHCMISVFLSIFPLGHPDLDTWKSPEVYGCANGKHIEYLWLEAHIFHIQTRKELILIPLPPVKEPLEFWLKFDVQSEHADMGGWGQIQVQRGPKEAI